MRRTYRVWTLEEKRAAVARMLSCRHAQLAREMGISKRLLYSWRKHLWRLEQVAEPETACKRTCRERAQRSGAKRNSEPKFAA